MSKKRMFSKDIVESDDFLDMPMTAQALYFHLSMEADDYGFISPRRIMRMIGAGQDDLKILLAKRFILGFESGVVVIKHWQLNNTVRKDRSHETTYSKEFKSLTNNEFGAYTEISRITQTTELLKITTLESQYGVEKVTTKRHTLTDTDNQTETIGQPNGNQMATEIRLDKIRLDKNTKDTNVSLGKVSSKKIDDMFMLWEVVVGFAITSKMKINREYASKLLKEYEITEIEKMMKGVSLSYEDQYAPRISNFKQLYDKWDDLKGWGHRKHRSSLTNQPQKGLRL
jgi:hypothetical protein